MRGHRRHRVGAERRPRTSTRATSQEAQQRASEAASQEFGGAETGPRAAYVDSVGRRVAAYSGVASPGRPIASRRSTRAVENAFAVPGGYVYITRQLMGADGR